MLDKYLQQTRTSPGLHTPYSPYSPRHQQQQRGGLVRSHSFDNSRASKHSRSFTGRPVRGETNDDLNSVFFHHSDDATFQSRMSDYQYSIHGNQSFISALTGLPTIVSQDTTTSSLFTTETDTDILERAIQEGMLRAAREAKDEVMPVQVHQNYRSTAPPLKMVQPKIVPPKGKSPEKKATEQQQQQQQQPTRRRSSVDNFADQFVTCDKNSMRSDRDNNKLSTTPRDKQQQSMHSGSHRDSSTNLNESSLRERKQHRKSVRQAQAERKHGRRSSSSSKPIVVEHTSQGTSGTEESSSMSTDQDPLDHFVVVGVDGSAENNRRQSSSRLSSSMPGGSTRGRARRSNSGDHKRRAIMAESRCASQPTLVATPPTTTRDATATAAEGEPHDGEGIQPKQRRKTRPPQTKKTRAHCQIVVHEEVPEGRSRSLSRAVGKVVRRSLSRAKRKIKGEEEKPKKKCTCPGPDIMLRSCPKHGEKAKAILERKAREEERLEKSEQDHHQRKDQHRRRQSMNSSRRGSSHHHHPKEESSREKRGASSGHRRSSTKEDKSSSSGHRRSSARDAPAKDGKRRERGRSKLSVSNHTEATAPLGASFSTGSSFELESPSSKHRLAQDNPVIMPLRTKSSTEV